MSVARDDDDEDRRTSRRRPVCLALTLAIAHRPYFAWTKHPKVVSWNVLGATLLFNPSPNIGGHLIHHPLCSFYANSVRWFFIARLMKSEAGLGTHANIGFVNNRENQRTGRRTSAQNFIFGDSIFVGISVCKEPIQIPAIVNIPTRVIVNFLHWPESRDSCLSDGFHIFLKLPKPKHGQSENKEKDRNKVKDGYNYSEFDLHNSFDNGLGGWRLYLHVDRRKWRRRSLARGRNASRS
jgi:hypothetical protein